MKEAEHCSIAKEEIKRTENGGVDEKEYVRCRYFGKDKLKSKSTKQGDRAMQDIVVVLIGIRIIR